MPVVATGNGDTDIGDVIAEPLDAVDPNGIITVEDQPTFWSGPHTVIVRIVIPSLWDNAGT
jgi:hypothetical protein